MSDLVAIRVDGLKELNKALKTIDRETAKAMRLILNDAAEIVVSVAKPRVPTRTGVARSTLGVSSTQTAARVKAGGNRAPYYPWLDFGGKTGRKRSVNRPFIKSGRYLWAAYDQESANIAKLIDKRMHALVTDAGLEVD